MKPVRTALAAALALAAAPAFAQQSPYTQTVFFGDSLTDAGAFRPALIQQGGPQAASLGRFTTNPGLVYAELIAEYYGTAANPYYGANGSVQNAAGTNFAVGGARVGTTAASPFGAVPSLQTQVNAYLAANGGRADANALYTVWGGANDIFAITNAGAPAAATIGSAVTAQVGIVNTLTTAGARYILVPTLPDIGGTPAFRAQGATAQATGTALSTQYNTALFGGLASAGLRVIPLNTFALLREVTANPAQFGIANVTGTACNPQITASSLTCNPGTYATPNAPYSYAFADGVHPSQASHEILADYALSILEAPRQVAILGHSASTVGRSRADRVLAQAEAGTLAEGEGMRWWADVRGDFQRYEHGNLYDGAGPALTAGVDWRTGGLTFGGFGGFGRSMLDWGRRGGEFDQSEAALGGYIGWRSGGAWVNGQASYTSLDFDIERRVQLGVAERVHRGSADGSNVSVGVEGGFEFGSGALKHGPVLGVLSQRIEIDGFAEDQADLSTSLAYREQDIDSLIGKIGWQMRLETGHFNPYARITFDREFEDEGGEAFARVQSLPATGDYAVPGVEFDERYATAQFGVRGEMFGFETDIGANLTTAQKGGNDATLFMTVGGRF
ncbi:autotransporter domain-containing protein [Lysobacter humi (ex Lee et al. 2017)]